MEDEQRGEVRDCHPRGLMKGRDTPDKKCVIERDSVLLGTMGEK